MRWPKYSSAALQIEPSTSHTEQTLDPRATRPARAVPWKEHLLSLRGMAREARVCFFR